MRMKETLTKNQKINLLNGQTVGFFPYMIFEDDEFYNMLYDMCITYYMNRSGEKPISPTYENLIQFIDENVDVEESAEMLLGKMIRGKFIDKWNRVYKVLIDEQYNALENFDVTTKKDGSNTDKVEYDNTKSKKGTNSDVTTYDTNVVDNSKTGRDETTTRNLGVSNDVYVFNSNNPSHDDYSNESEKENIKADADKNTYYNKEEKRGTESKQFGVDESLSHNGVDKTTYEIDETSSKKGRDGSGSSLIKEELDLRNTQIFFDIIYNDIDSIATLQIYF